MSTNTNERRGSYVTIKTIGDKTKFFVTEIKECFASEARLDELEARLVEALRDGRLTIGIDNNSEKHELLLWVEVPREVPKDDFWEHMYAWIRVLQSMELLEITPHKDRSAGIDSKKLH